MRLTQETLERLVAKAKEFGATRLVLFGSALENPDQARDIDLAADIPGLELFRFADELERDLLCPIDIVPLGGENESHPFIQYVLRKGKKLL